jgi:methionyl aminopeptidase
MALIKNKADLAAMRESGRMLAMVLQHLKKEISIGMPTKQLGILAAAELKKLGGQPAFLGYGGFPDVVCVSVNDEVVHGIPGSYIIKDGDIIGMDFGVKFKGMITDSAVTVGVGQISKTAKQLIATTERSLLIGITQVKNGAHVGDIGAAIEAELHKGGYGVVENLVGHGVGYKLHEPPEIPNFGSKGKGPILKTGMAVAIEPMANIGDKKVYMQRDGWTIKTRDGSLSAHFEHTVLVTEDGAEILTRN